MPKRKKPMESPYAGLLPDRYPQPDLFICDVADAVLKDIFPHMEHPFYALSKKPDTRERIYRNNDNWIKITPSIKGQATIYDKDILIYCISQLMMALKRGEKVSPRVRLSSVDLLRFTNRGSGGKDYAALSEAIDRLAGTRITTNIVTGHEQQTDNFGLIDAASLRRQNGPDGRLLWCEVTLSSWVFNAIEAREVLTLHPHYFRLRKPLERRIYELARKHCGRQPSWTASLETLLHKSGSQSPTKRFRQMIRELVSNDHLPDYRVTLEGDNVTFRARDAAKMRGTVRTRASAGNTQPSLFGDTRPVTVSSRAAEEAREAALAAGTGWDIYAIERQFLEHVRAAGTPDNVDAAFLGFVRKKISEKA